MFSLVKNDIGAESVNKRGNNSNSRKFKREKRRDHAPTHGQFPCPAFGPHDDSVSASDSLDFFFLVYLSFFLFFLSSFSLTFSIRSRYLSSFVCLYTFAHAHIVTFVRSKCQKKFSATFTWTRRGLITRQTLAVFKKDGVALGKGREDNNINPIKQSRCFPLIETLSFRRRGDEERTLRLWSRYQIIHLTAASQSLPLAPQGLHIFAWLVES